MKLENTYWSGASGRPMKPATFKSQYVTHSPYVHTLAPLPSLTSLQGAVLFASVVSCLGWDNLTASHWLGPASFYVTILLSLASIFTAAQQTIVLPDKDAAKSYDLDQIEALRVSLLGPSRDDEEPALTTLFAWQCPIMLMGYSVVFFLVGLCTVVITPLSLRPEWGAAAKVRTYVYFVVLCCGFH